MRIIAGLVLVNILVLVAILVLQNNLPPVVPLFYGLPQGQQQLASRISLIIPPIISIAIIVLNSLIIRILNDSFLQKMLLGLATTITILSAISVIKIIALVGSF